MVYDGEFASSAADEEFGRYLYQFKQGQIGYDEFFRQTSAMGVNVGIENMYYDTSETSMLDIRFGTAVSYDTAMKAVSIIKSSENSSTVSALLNQLSSEAIEYFEIYGYAFHFPDDYINLKMFANLYGGTYQLGAYNGNYYATISIGKTEKSYYASGWNPNAPPTSMIAGDQYGNLVMYVLEGVLRDHFKDESGLFVEISPGQTYSEEQLVGELIAITLLTGLMDNTFVANNGTTVTNYSLTYGNTYYAKLEIQKINEALSHFVAPIIDAAVSTAIAGGLGATKSIAKTFTKESIKNIAEKIYTDAVENIIGHELPPTSITASLIFEDYIEQYITEPEARKTEIAEANAKKVAGSKMFFVYDSSINRPDQRDKYNSGLEGLINAINDTIIPGDEYVQKVKDYAIGYIEEIINLNNNPTDAKEIVNSLVR